MIMKIHQSQNRIPVISENENLEGRKTDAAKKSANDRSQENAKETIDWLKNLRLKKQTSKRLAT